MRDFPNLRDAIFRQLAARLPANPDLGKLDPMLLLALVDQGRQAMVMANATHPASNTQLQEAVDAAKEIISRLTSGNFPRAEAADASFLLGIFQEYLGQKQIAVDSLLDHIARFGQDPHAHADVALDRARSIIGELRQGSPSDPEVERLEERFLPIAINPPFNHREFALQYAASLFAESKWKEAIPYYQMVPDTEPPGRLLVARYGEMVALKNLLESTPHLQAEQKQQWIDRIQTLTQAVNSLAGDVINSSAPAAEKLRAKTTLARMTLIAADITRRQHNDPQRVLQLLNGFEESVTGLPDANSLISGALFLRVQADMQLGKNDDATKMLVKYLDTASANEGAQAVRDLLTILNNELDEARRRGRARRTSGNWRTTGRCSADSWSNGRPAARIRRFMVMHTPTRGLTRKPSGWPRNWRPIRRPGSAISPRRWNFISSFNRPRTLRCIEPAWKQARTRIIPIRW